VDEGEEVKVLADGSQKREGGEDHNSALF